MKEHEIIIIYKEDQIPTDTAAILATNNEMAENLCLL